MCQTSSILFKFEFHVIGVSGTLYKMCTVQREIEDPVGSYQRVSQTPKKCENCGGEGVGLPALPSVSPFVLLLLSLTAPPFLLLAKTTVILILPLAPVLSPSHPLNCGQAESEADHAGLTETHDDDILKTISDHT